jgi:hypothetical protein
MREQFVAEGISVECLRPVQVVSTGVREMDGIVDVVVAIDFRRTTLDVWVLRNTSANWRLSRIARFPRSAEPRVDMVTLGEWPIVLRDRSQPRLGETVTLYHPMRAADRDVPVGTYVPATPCVLVRSAEWRALPEVDAHGDLWLHYTDLDNTLLARVALPFDEGSQRFTPPAELQLQRVADERCLAPTEEALASWSH